LFVLSWALVAILQPGASEAGRDTESLRQGYTRFYKAIANSELEFVCGNGNYKLEKKLWAGPKLYVQDQLDWHQIADGDSLRLLPGGVEVKGLGYNIQHFKEYVESDAPIHIFFKPYHSDYGHSIPYWTKYYEAIGNNDTVEEFLISIDFLSVAPSWVGRNVNSISRNLEFNEGQYRKDQSLKQSSKNVQRYINEIHSLEDLLQQCIDKRMEKELLACNNDRNVEIAKRDLDNAREQLKKQVEHCKSIKFSKMSPIFKEAAIASCPEFVHLKEAEVRDYEQAIKLINQKTAKCRKLVNKKNYDDYVCRNERYKLEEQKNELEKILSENEKIETHNKKLEESVSNAPRQFKLVIKPGKIQIEDSCWSLSELYNDRY